MGVSGRRLISKLEIGTLYYKSVLPSAVVNLYSDHGWRTEYFWAGSKEKGFCVFCVDWAGCDCDGACSHSKQSGIQFRKGLSLMNIHAYADDGWVKVQGCTEYD